MGSLLGIAFLHGFSGSPHCVGMCGPLMLAIPGRAKSIWWATLQYHAGRVLTYMFLGLLVGMIGISSYLPSFRQWVSAGSALLMLALIWIPVWKGRKPGEIFQPKASASGLLQKVLKRDSWYTQWAAGILNGFLPCGLVYTALAVAVPATSPWDGMLIMGAFGVGTLPLTVLVTISGPIISLPFRQKMAKLLPWLLTGVALLLLIRSGFLFWEERNVNQPVPIHCTP